MNPFVLSSLLIVLTALPLGYFVYSQNKKQWANRIWLIYSLGLSLWGLFGMFIGLTQSPEFALIYWRLAMSLGIVWMPVLFYHFAYLYAPWGGKEKKFLIGAYVVTVLFAILAFTKYYIPHVELVFGSLYWSRPGVIFHLLTLWWFVMTGYSHTKLYKSSKQMPIERQNQIKYFIFASSVGYLGGFLDFSLTYGLPVYPWGNFFITIYPFIMAYAIIKHGLFDIFVFVKRAFYSTVLVAVVAVSINSISVFNVYLQNQFGVSPWIGPIFAGILSVYIVYFFLESYRNADKVKREFITVAAHKLRTPLTHVRYIVEGLKDVKTPEEVAPFVKELDETNTIMTELINTLLDVTNLETQSETYKFNSIDVSAITRSVIQIVAGVSHYKKIDITLNIAEHLPLAEGNEKNTRFVIQSLIENALAYTPAGGHITLGLSVDQGYLVWSITDNGIGISKEDSEKVFDKFFRSESALKTDTEGTGLALFMSRNLIKRQGGYIAMESAGPGLGSRFWFTLPVSRKS